MNKSPPQVIALIATSSRHDLLMNRALPSVVTQAHPADLIVVVDDGPQVDHPSLRERLRLWEGEHDIPLVVLRNARTPGASGAWNTGIAWLTEQGHEPDRTYVAILDDDDAWASGHLRGCLERAVETSADMVIAGLLRYEDGLGAPRPQRIPDALDAHALLRGNPHIQGSNLFVRLSRLLEAGMFDEALRSCTDRDLCLRLADLGDVGVVSLRCHTVHHHLDAPRRLSEPGSEARSQGLETFWSKHRGRMTDADRVAYLERASRLFDWRPAAGPALGIRDSMCASSREDRAGSPGGAAAGIHPAEALSGSGMDLVVGLILDPDRTALVQGLLEDLSVLAGQPSMKALDVVLLVNGPCSEAIREVIAGARSAGLRLHRLPQATLPPPSSGVPRWPSTVRAPIAWARTALQRGLAAFVLLRPEAVVWILDDDMRLDPLITGDGGAGLLGRLQVLRATGIAVAVGSYQGAPPLPEASVLRTGLVDLIHNLWWLGGLRPDDPLPDRGPENRRAASRWPEHYYDLSSLHTDHLEAPFWLTPAVEGETVRHAFTRMMASVPALLSGGESPFRTLELCLDSTKVRDPDHRGGNTFIFDHKALSVPNVAPRCDGRVARRSDMMWCALNRRLYGRQVVAVELRTRHHRPASCEPSVDLDKLLDDIRGHAAYRALRDSLEALGQPCERGRLPEGWDPADAQALYLRHLQRRTSAAQRSLHRIRGLLKTLCSAGYGEREGLWYTDDPAAIEALHQSESWCLRTQALVTQSLVVDLGRKVGADMGLGARALFEDLEAAIQPQPPSRSLEDALASERRDNALAQIRRLGAPRAPLQHLGQGQEGVCFTDGAQVYKCLDRGIGRRAADQIAFLRAQVGRWSVGQPGLPPLTAVVTDGVHALLSYPFEPSEPYRGGHGPAMVRMLRRLRAHGLVCWNLHPDNLRLVAGELRLIDWGADIRPWSAQGWEQLCRRAWLSWRWHHRADLKQLMRRALKRDDLPELDGVDRLRQAVEDTSTAGTVDPALIERVRSLPGRVALDYGCGKGKLARALAEAGWEVVGYDPDPSLERRWLDSPANLAFGGSALLADLLGEGRRFDVVICSLVLCGLAEYQAELQHLRKLVRDDGRVLVAICDPFYSQVRETPLRRRETPAHALGDTFTWTSHSHLTGGQRIEVHRPLRQLRRDLMEVGLILEDWAEADTVDLSRFEPASDHLIATCRPRTSPRVSASLMIKACAMEAETLEVQVQHLITQLEGPQAFEQRLLALDLRAEGMPRPWATPDLEGTMAAAERLLRQGWIDAVCMAPTAREDISALHQRWFGVEASRSHAANGSPTTATLAGFEACRGDYILQVDADLMIHRPGPHRDYLAEMASALDGHPRALTVALGITSEGEVEISEGDDRGPWRVEVRGSLFHRQRLLAARPFPNALQGDGGVAQAWYRACDLRIRQLGLASLRGGHGGIAFIHPPNHRKRGIDEWLRALDRVEQAQIPQVQIGQVEWTGDAVDWAVPYRREPFVFVVCGRGVPPQRLRRCLESMLRQRGEDWGAVVVDDASDVNLQAYLRHLLRPHAERVTFMANRRRRGGIANLVHAVRRVCQDPETVIITLDADDCLLTERVLDTLRDAYDRGADVTVGSMLRTDKDTRYPVDLGDPRGARGGNVWQHLRSFKKRLFDAIPDERLHLDGRYVDTASDWAYMVPIVELAQQPLYIEAPLYLYEPSGAHTGAGTARREVTIARLMAKGPLHRR